MKIDLLGKIAAVRTVGLFRDKAPDSTEHGNARVITIRDLTNSQSLALPETGTFVQVDSEDLESALKPGDILLPGRGDIYRARLFRKSSIPTFPAGQIHVLSVLDGYNPVYLTWLLNRPAQQENIRSSLTGTAIKALSKSNLQSLPIPYIDPEAQCRIAEIQSLTDERTLLSLELLRIMQKEADMYCEGLLHER